MSFALTDEQESLVALTREIVSDLGAHERLTKLETDPPAFDRDGWAKIAEAGLVGIGLPEEYGGGGLGFLETCLVAEQIGHGPLYVPYVATAVLGALTIAR